MLKILTPVLLLLPFLLMSCGHTEQEYSLQDDQGEGSDIELMVKLVQDLGEARASSFTMIGRPSGWTGSPNYVVLKGQYRNDTGFFMIRPNEATGSFVPLIRDNKFLAPTNYPEAVSGPEKNDKGYYHFDTVLKSETFGIMGVALIDYRNSPHRIEFYSWNGLGADNGVSREENKGELEAIDGIAADELTDPVTASLLAAISSIESSLPGTVNESPLYKAKLLTEEILPKYSGKFSDEKIEAALSKLEAAAKKITETYSN